MITAFDAWQSPPAGRVPPDGGIDVWWLDLARPRLTELELSPYLTAAEAMEVGRFRRPEDRCQRAAARVFLRWVLGRHALDCAPKAVRWERDERGRPHLVAEARDGGAGFDFNLSHAGSHVLVAFAASTRVGVDVEIATVTDTAALARVCAAGEERSWLEAPVEEAERRERFFRLWTMKEAVLKCHGWGLGCDPRRCSLDVPAGRADLRLPDRPGRSYRAAALPLTGPAFGAVAWPGLEARPVRGWRAPDTWLAEVAAF